MSSKNIIWNRFIEEICYKNIDKLSDIQKKAVLVFWYDSEINSGGHCGYFDCYPNTVPEELYSAIIEIGNKEIADNYMKAVQQGKYDGYEKADTAYYNFSPALADYLMNFVEKNKEYIIT